MKTKIRGLVFVGFAAAVFAQSALAVDPDDKTVTSKTYVDSKVEATVNSATTITSSSPDDKAPSSLNVYKFVTGQIISAGGGVDGNVAYHTDKIGYLDPNWDGISGTGLSNPYMVTKADLETHPTWADHVVKWEIIVPDSRIDKTAASITTSGTSNNTQVQENIPTAKAVYDFVTEGDPNNPDFDGFQRKVSTSEATALAGFNYNTTTNTYNDAGQGVMIGHRGTGTGADSEWYIFGAKANGVDATNSANNHLSYLTVSRDSEVGGRDKFLVSIKPGALAENATAISTGGQATGNDAYLTRDKLTTAKAVYDYAVKQNWTQANAGKTLVVGSDGIVTVSTSANPDIPGVDDMPDECTTAAGGHVCALVAYYDANAGGTGVGGVKYEWTVMAPTN